MSLFTKRYKMYKDNTAAINTSIRKWNIKGKVEEAATGIAS